MIIFTCSMRRKQKICILCTDDTFLSEVKVRDEDVVTADDTIYKTTYDVKTFPKEKKHRIVLKFNKVCEAHS